MAGGSDDYDDPFGDADFLNDFDVDAAVAGHRGPPSQQEQQQQKQPGSNKRAKTSSSSTSPYSTLSAGTPSSDNGGGGSGGGGASSSSSFGRPPPRSSAATGVPPPSGGSANADSDSDLERSLTSTLQKHFGHPTYRPGQLEALTALVGPGGCGPPRDVAVFWSTGSGKSIVYQIPPLHLNKIGVVVSPLISLMEDQVSKLNGLIGGGQGANGGGGGGVGGDSDVAIFLGSGQQDPDAERRALDGHYRLIYLTPEKLLSGNFLDRLGGLHTRIDHPNHPSGNPTNDGGGNICLIAVDESHCVSEWGHDFRPEYRNLGSRIRSHPTLHSVPLLALTATAVPRVQVDILKCLRMGDNVKVVKKSFDRTNLAITVRRKPSAGGGSSYSAALQPLADELISSSKVGRRGQSTIVYCPTRDAVDEIARYLQAQFRSAGVADHVRAEPYHAGMSGAARSEAHTNFLVGRTQVIVATVAFGMGIDKPDTRRVVHWGAPKTVEEYYQQIGRAGRDGLPAAAVMYANDSDFSRYKSDFYLGKLSSEARAAVERSIDSLRSYAMDGESCRRAALLRFFGEVPEFGERCGTCDACRDRERHGDDAERDFAADGARIVLRAADALNGEQGLSVVEKVVKGQVVERWRYRYGVDPGSTRDALQAERESMPKKRPVSFFKELVPALVSRGYLARGSKSAKVAGSSYSNSWTTYSVTSKGKSALNDASATVVLPVPASVREIERIEEEKRQKTLSQLKDAGFDLDQIPKAEVETGDGEVIRALKLWHSYIDGLQRRDNVDRVNELDDLRGRIEAWRADMAAQYRMAPGAVMEEHLVIKIAYATASLPPGSKVDSSTLLSVGVRSRGLDSLVTALGEWTEETSKSDGRDGASAASAPMCFPSDEPYAPPGPWEFAVYKPNKKTGLATWESSYNRFVEGEHPHAIAMSPANGRPIQVGTVVKHIQDGLVQGRAVPLRRLASVVVPPNKEEWETLCKCEDVTGFDVTGDPSISGADAGPFRMTDFLVPVMGNAFVMKDLKERTEEEAAKFGHWCGLLNWYMALRRAKYEPQFEGGAGGTSTPKVNIDV